ncbi:MAG: DUF2306 domain-containing protein [Anaerolineales bacterium]|nr:DUF2306 domain-containing protein [Anaerolineales bacterium]
MKDYSHLISARIFSNRSKEQTISTPQKKAFSKKAGLGWSLMLFLALLLFLLASRYLTLNPDVYFPEQKGVYIANTTFLLMHIIGSMLAILIGPFQFLPKIRTGRLLNLHRWLGRIYLLGILIGGTGGLYMAQLAYGGIVTRLGFTTLALLWLVSGGMAYKTIRNKQLEIHRKWMTVNYALTFAGVTLRLWQVIFGISGLDFLTGYLIVSWLCWAPNLLVAFWINSRDNSV